MRGEGEVSKHAGGFLLVLFLVIIGLSFFAIPTLYASEPFVVEEDFYIYCTYWAMDDFGTENYVVDNKGESIPMFEPCRKILGLGPLVEERDVDWLECKRRCPNWEEP